MKTLDNLLKGLGLSDASIEEIQESTLNDIKEQFRNIHVIEVKYFPPTNNSGSKIRLKSFWHKQFIYIPFHNSKYAYTNDIAIEWLNNNGFNVLNSGSGKDVYYINCLNFKKLKEK